MTSTMIWDFQCAACDKRFESNESLFTVTHKMEDEGWAITYYGSGVSAVESAVCPDHSREDLYEAERVTVECQECDWEEILDREDAEEVIKEHNRPCWNDFHDDFAYHNAQIITQEMSKERKEREQRWREELKKDRYRIEAESRYVAFLVERDQAIRNSKPTVVQRVINFFKESK